MKSLFNKVAGLKTLTQLFLVNLAKFLWPAILKNICEQDLLFFKDGDEAKSKECDYAPS